MEAIDPIIRELGKNALNHQEPGNCNSRYKNMGFLIALILILFLVLNANLQWPIVSSLIAITAMKKSPLLVIERARHK